MQQIRSNSMSTHARTFLASLLAVLLAGCAGGSSKVGPQHAGFQSLPRPPVVLVYQFAVDADDVVVDTFGGGIGQEASTLERVKRGRVFARELALKLVKKVAKLGIGTRVATPKTTVPMNALVVKGQFLTIDEGSKVKRTMIGFGAGAEEVRVRVQVYQMTETGLNRISEAEGEAHGRKTPGMVGPAAIAGVTGNVIGLVVQGGMQIKSEAIDGSMDTTLNNIVEEFVENAARFYKRQGWL
ncbi:MAG: DUF4410 domain-containing protein [Nitrospirota bacterium]|nr:DUF4410 domain-containing protein [Nitrospirota bacterium]